jgi:membrane protein DedA with SNARE-associated domain
MTDPSVGLGALAALFGAVVSGTVLPFVPTGAAVSAEASLAGHDNVVVIALVVSAGAAGAYVSDLLTYAALRIIGSRANTGSGRLASWLRRQEQGSALHHVQRQLDDHELRTLLLSRLVPAGQLPVLLAAAFGGYSWRRYAVADVGAATLWSVTYAGIGLAGRAIFPRAWEGVATGIAIVLIISAGSALISRRHPSRVTADHPSW